MKSKIAFSVAKGIQLWQLKNGDPFMYATPGSSVVDGEAYVAGPYVALDEPGMRWVTRLADGNPTQWKEHISVHPIGNPSLTGEVSVG